MKDCSSSLASKFLLFTSLAALLLTFTLAANATDKVLYSFKGGDDGANPSSSLIVDRLGNLYGTTEGGGGGACDCGTVFMLSPPVTRDGTWTETVLYRFQGPDGAGPAAYTARPRSAVRMTARYSNFPLPRNPEEAGRRPYCINSTTRKATMERTRCRIWLWINPATYMEQPFSEGATRKQGSCLRSHRQPNPAEAGRRR